MQFLLKLNIRKNIMPDHFYTLAKRDLNKMDGNVMMMDQMENTGRFSVKIIYKNFYLELNIKTNFQGCTIYSIA